MWGYFLHHHPPPLRHRPASVPRCFHCASLSPNPVFNLSLLHSLSPSPWWTLLSQTSICHSRDKPVCPHAGKMETGRQRDRETEKRRIKGRQINRYRPVNPICRKLNVRISPNAFSGNISQWEISAQKFPYAAQKRARVGICFSILPSERLKNYLK